MNIASATRTIKFISKSGTYTAVIMSPCGDLYQEYSSRTAGATFSPNFEAAGPYYQPVLNFILTNSRTVGGLVTPDDMKYYLGNDEIIFDASGVSSGTMTNGVFNNAFAGVFKKITPNADTGVIYCGLQILKNLVLLTNYTSTTIRMVAAVSSGSQSDEIEASYSIPITMATGVTYRVTIAAGDQKNLTITEKNGTCILKALVYHGDEAVTGWTAEWFKMGVSDNGDGTTSAGWSPFGTGEAVTVNESDIRTSAEFMVKVLVDGKELQDMQTVMDVSDPYDIEPCPSPEDETITEDLSGNGTVTYTPKLVQRGATQAANQNQEFLFVLTDFAGNILNPATKDVPAKTFTVTRADCQQGNDISLTIIAV